MFSSGCARANPEIGARAASDRQGNQAPAGRAQWISGLSPEPLGHAALIGPRAQSCGCARAIALSRPILMWHLAALEKNTLRGPSPRPMAPQTAALATEPRASAGYQCESASDLILRVALEIESARVGPRAVACSGSRVHASDHGGKLTSDSIGVAAQMEMRNRPIRMRRKWL